MHLFLEREQGGVGGTEGKRENLEADSLLIRAGRGRWGSPTRDLIP